jgi:beta-glucosidase
LTALSSPRDPHFVFARNEHDGRVLRANEIHTARNENGFWSRLAVAGSRTLLAGLPVAAASAQTAQVSASGPPGGRRGPWCIQALWPAAPPALAPDTALEAGIGQLLAQISLEQKVGQLIRADIASITPDDLRHYPLGSILNAETLHLVTTNLRHRVSGWLSLVGSMRHPADPSMADRFPPFWGTDAVHGHNNLAGATIFPHNIGLGARPIRS